MSALRKTDRDRRTTRQALASPYRRPVQKSWLGTIVDIWNNITGTQPESELDESDMEGDDESASEDADVRPASAAENLARRGRELSDRMSSSTVPPRSTVFNNPRIPRPPAGSADDPIVLVSEPPSPLVNTSSIPTDSKLPAKPLDSTTKNIELLKAFFLERRASAPLNAVEYIGLRALVEKSIEDGEKLVAARHSSLSPLGNIPPHTGAPLFTMGSTTATRPSTSSAASTKTRTTKGLHRNLSSGYKWTGIGSTRINKNRYQSSAFGPQRRSQGSKLNISPPPTLSTGHASKRRKTVHDAACFSTETTLPLAGPSKTSTSPTAVPSVAPPSSGAQITPPPPTSLNTIASSTSNTEIRPTSTNLFPPVTPIPRSRIGMPAKPTTPAVPSPLRQGWNQAGSPPSPRQRPAATAPITITTTTTTTTSTTTAPTAPTTSTTTATTAPTTDSNANPSSSTSSPSKQQTKAASFMTELIKEVTPPTNKEKEKEKEKEIVKPTKEDVANPYDIKGLPPVPKKKAEKGRKRKAGEERAKEAEAAKEREKQKQREKELAEISAQRIIEATVPKGSKRARPPADIEFRKTASSSTSTKISGIFGDSVPRRELSFVRTNGINGSSSYSRSSTTTTTITEPVIEEVAEDDLASERPSLKKQKSQHKPFFGNGNVTVQEIDDNDGTMDKSTVIKPTEVVEPSAPSAAGPSNPFSLPAKTSKSAPSGLVGLKSSAPREPSKLRFGVTADQEEDSSSAASPAAASVPTPVSTSAPASTAQPASFAFGETYAGNGFKFDPAPSTDLAPMTTSTPGRGMSLLKSSSKFNSSLASIPEAPSASPLHFTSISSTPAFGATATSPTFSFSVPSSTYLADYTEAMKAAKTVPVTSLPTFVFTFNAIMPDTSKVMKSVLEDFERYRKSAESVAVPGLLPPFTLKVDGKSKSSAVPLSTPTSTTSTAPTSAPTPAPSMGGFDWSAAGMKAPQKAAGTWTCTSCMCSSPESATKCTVCEADKPAAASKPETSGGFDWAAAGMKAPEKKAGTWTCSSCMCSSPDSAVQCTVCEADRPAAASTSKASTSGGFNWGAAGMKEPEKKAGTWTCSLCMCSSPDSAAKCVACDTDKPSVASKPAVTGGFDWAASGMKAPEKKSGTWSCASCMCSSPDSAVKCVVCDADKPGAASKPATTGGFNWAAAGMSAPEKKTGTWSCALCMCSSSDSAVQCTVCGADKP